MYGINVGDGGGLLWLAILGAVALFALTLWIASSAELPSRTHELIGYHDRPEA